MCQKSMPILQRERCFVIFFKLKIGVTSHGLGPKLLNEDYLTNPTTGWFVTRTAMAGMISV